MELIIEDVQNWYWLPVVKEVRKAICLGPLVAT